MFGCCRLYVSVLPAHTTDAPITTGIGVGLTTTVRCVDPLHPALVVSVALSVLLPTVFQITFTLVPDELPLNTPPATAHTYVLPDVGVVIV